MLPLSIPGVFAEMAGVTVSDYDPQYQKQASVSGVFGEGTCDLWCDVVEPQDAEVLGVYTSDYYAGEPCFTKHAFGNGSVYYMGCDLDVEAMRRLAAYLAGACGVKAAAGAQSGVEIVDTVDTTDGTNHALFILNHNEHAVVVPVDGTYTDQITGKQVTGQVLLKAFDVAVLKG